METAVDDCTGDEEVAVALTRAAVMPPAKVEVPVLVTVKLVVVRFVVLAVVSEAVVAVRLVVVALVKVALVAVMVVEVRSSIVAAAELMALAIVPAMDEAVMEPPVMVGFWMVVPERLSMRWDWETIWETAAVWDPC